MKWGKFFLIGGILLLVVGTYSLYDWGQAFLIYSRHYKYWLIGMAIIGLILAVGMTMAIVGYRKMKNARKISN